jgi:hypothetical protein
MNNMVLPNLSSKDVMEMLQILIAMTEPLKFLHK